MHPDRTLPVHDLFYVMDGEWSLYQNNSYYALHKDDAVFLRAGAHHYGAKPCSPNTRVSFVHFDIAEGDRLDVELSTDDVSGYNVGKMACLPTIINCSRHGSVMQLFQQLIELYWASRRDKQRQLGILLDALMCELAYVHQDQQAKDEEWLPRVLEQLQRDPAHMYSVEELAAIAGMSIRTFSDVFKRAKGQSVHQYQLNSKLEQAFTVVRAEPGRTLSDIASQFGFYDAYHFSRVFKNRYGFSPKHFRRGIGHGKPQKP